MTEQDVDAPVLVAVINRVRDLTIARDQGWYRIPLRRAPRRVAADYLAFYQTKAFGDEGWAVNYFAAVQRFHVACRVELLPDEPDHPRAGERYYKVEIGPLERLPRPIPSHRLRRITFIPTTLGRLLAAEEINDLWWRDDRQERLWLALREAGLQVECRYRVGEPAVEIDFALFCREGRIAVFCERVPAGPERLVPIQGITEAPRSAPRGRPASHAGGRWMQEPAGIDYGLAAAGWQVLRFSRQQLEEALPGCVTTVLALVRALGGQAAPLGTV